ncbi:hypothetical protein SMACR_03259 [Sordaria macrospora]|uniref:WGS project CABT00000000 data, contig 2.10 n=2 Tax=Sordaria macrospora TaxID=5147 RepID=F7VWD1_SORMK|nr:uncharacterized protein SMAC_03259 [Sordaria macrospora k-hell]KAA8635679.1 hypothetical protein SMACR_03259 [Sordaria macrospora]KAH7630105.1 hypothetical protein B0T09DRAFT_383668 [Sordaria sp. MPI-SDFR-AT-0083]WPJ66784.1 hypothetical protein SMAC4_03259 [Sordaria macrospora]CCC09699.1 unnamed protein product [Sordaria macrospora k-hell]
MTESSPETPLLPKIPCTCPRGSECSLRCYALLPDIRPYYSSDLDSSQQLQNYRLRLKQRIRTAFDHLHSLFQSFISSSDNSSTTTSSTSSPSISPSPDRDAAAAAAAAARHLRPSSYLKKWNSSTEGQDSSISSTSTSTSASSDVDIPTPNLVLQCLQTLVDRSRNRNQRLNTQLAEATAEDMEPLPISLFELRARVLFDTLITDYEFFLMDLVPYYREDWLVEGRGRCLMAEFVGEITRTEKKLGRWIGNIL